jgi:hypothetical protein
MLPTVWLPHIATFCNRLIGQKRTQAENAANGVILYALIPKKLSPQSQNSNSDIFLSKKIQETLILSFF